VEERKEGNKLWKGRYAKKVGGAQALQEQSHKTKGRGKDWPVRLSIGGERGKSGVSELKEGVGGMMGR